MKYSENCLDSTAKISSAAQIENKTTMIANTDSGKYTNEKLKQMLVTDMNQTIYSCIRPYKKQVSTKEKRLPTSKKFRLHG